MPIFESNEEITSEEMERQQGELDAKVRRRQEQEAFRRSLGEPTREPFWMSENENE